MQAIGITSIRIIHTAFIAKAYSSRRTVDGQTLLCGLAWTTKISMMISNRFAFFRSCPQLLPSLLFLPEAVGKPGPRPGLLKRVPPVVSSLCPRRMLRLSIEAAATKTTTAIPTTSCACSNWEWRVSKVPYFKHDLQAMETTPFPLYRVHLGSHSGALALKTENFSKETGRFSKARRWIY